MPRARKTARKTVSEPEYPVLGWGEAYWYDRVDGDDPLWVTGMRLEIIWDDETVDGDMIDYAWEDTYRINYVVTPAKYEDDPFFWTTHAAMIRQYDDVMLYHAILPHAARNVADITKFSEPRWCDLTKSADVKVTYKDGTNTRLPYSSDFALSREPMAHLSNDEKAYDRSWKAVAGQCKKLVDIKLKTPQYTKIRNQANAIAEAKSVKEANEAKEKWRKAKAKPVLPKASDGAKLIIMDLEWHDLSNGPLSQIACASMDGVYASNHYIFYKPLHEDWLGVSDATISPWDDTTKSTALYVALYFIFTDIPVDSILIYHGTTDRAALMWAIEFQIEDERDRNTIRGLMNKKKIRFASSSRWLSATHDALYIRENLFPPKQGKPPKKGSGTVSELYNRIFVQRLKGFPKESSYATNEQIIPLLRNELSDLEYFSRTSAKEVVNLKRVLDKNHEGVHVVFHDATTDVTALKSVMIVLGILMSYADELQFEPDESQWPSVHEIARKMSKFSNRDYGLYGTTFKVSDRLAKYFYAMFTSEGKSEIEHAAKDAANLKKMVAKKGIAPHLTRHVDVCGRDNVRRLLARIQKRVTRPDDIPDDIEEQLMREIIEPKPTPHDPANVNKIHQTEIELKKEWKDQVDQPRWILTALAAEPGVFLLHCKHCITLKINAEKEECVMKDNALFVSDTSTKLKRQAWRFCKLCKKYKGDFDNQSYKGGASPVVDDYGDALIRSTAEEVPTQVDLDVEIIPAPVVVIVEPDIAITSTKRWSTNRALADHITCMMTMTMLTPPPPLEFDYNNTWRNPPPTQACMFAWLAMSSMIKLNPVQCITPDVQPNMRFLKKPMFDVQTLLLMTHIGPSVDYTDTITCDRYRRIRRNHAVSFQSITIMLLIGS